MEKLKMLVTSPIGSFHDVSKKKKASLDAIVKFWFMVMESSQQSSHNHSTRQRLR